MAWQLDEVRGATRYTSVTKGEAVNWTIDSFQSFLNEPEDIKLLLSDDSKKSIMNSPGVIKGIIARLPKCTRDEMVKVLCKSNQHLPKFQFLLEFVQKHLKLVSHLLMHIITDAQSYAARPKDAESGRKEKVSKSAGQSGKTAVKSYFAQNMTSSKCLVVGYDKFAPHALWDYAKFGTLSDRDKWAVAKKRGCCYKCLNNGHHQADCKNQYCCRICKNAQHHYQLCPNEKATQEQVSADCHNVLFDESLKLLPIIPVQAINLKPGRAV